MNSASVPKRPKFTPWFHAILRFSHGSITSIACTSLRFRACTTIHLLSWSSASTPSVTPSAHHSLRGGGGGGSALSTRRFFGAVPSAAGNRRRAGFFAGSPAAAGGVGVSLISAGNAAAR